MRKKEEKRKRKVDFTLEKMDCIEFSDDVLFVHQLSIYFNEIEYLIKTRNVKRESDSALFK